VTSPGERSSAALQADAASVATIADLAALLRALRRREARLRQGRELTYHQLAERTGWSVSVIGEYLTGTSLPSTSRFDILVQVLGARAAELGALSSARDRVADARRQSEQQEPEPELALPVPHELPAPPNHFVGRVAELARLDAAAFEGETAASRVAVVTGMGGVGKSALVLRWARQVAEMFPHGQLYVNLRGYDLVEPVDPADALARLLRSLGVDPARLPLDVSERSARYRTLLAARRMLIVLDNARDAEQVRPLLPGSPLCMVVVTSRDVLAGTVATEGAARVPIDVLSLRESTTLLHRLASDRFGGAPDAAEWLAGHCGGLPLAIRVVAEVAARRAEVPVKQLVEDLRDERTRLDALDTGEERSGVRSVLSWSYRLLSTEGARLFRLLGYAPGPDLSAAALAALGGLDGAQTRRLVTELTRSHMLTEPSSGRYGLHDVLRAFAVEAGQAVQFTTELDRAMHRLFDHYLGTAAAADHLLNPHRIAMPSEIATPEGFAYLAPIHSAEAAHGWFDQERAVLLAMVQLAAQRGYPEYAWQLTRAMATYLDRAGHWHELAAASAIALEATTDPAPQACMRDLLARAAIPLGLTDTAIEHYSRALELLEALDDQLGQATLHSNLAGVCGLSGRYRQGVEHSRLALGIFRELGHRVGQAMALNNIGMIHTELAEYALALPACQEALALTRELGDHRVEAHVLDSLGVIHRGMREYDQAVDCFRGALESFEDLGDRLQIATEWTNLGDTYADMHRPDAARQAWQASLAILDDLQHPDAAAVRSRLETGA
jgi:tetratricopeptide (TPR) repeat protein/transcriptional regulator with XRE-family HTH domain